MLNVFSLEPGVSVSYHKYQSDVLSSIETLIKQYHPNMWVEMAANPCDKGGHECPIYIGITNPDPNGDKLDGVSCKEHVYSLTTVQLKPWFAHCACRVLTIKDLRRVGNELTTELKQLKLFTELAVDPNEIDAINSQTPEIKMASFNILRIWYDQQIYKADAFVSLCDALRKAGLGGLLETCLGVLPDS